MTSETDRRKEMNRGRVRRHRSRRRRIDYMPWPDVLAIIERCLGHSPKNTLAGVIDDLIRRGYKSISGNGEK